MLSAKLNQHVLSRLREQPRVLMFDCCQAGPSVANSASWLSNRLSRLSSEHIRHPTLVSIEPLSHHHSNFRTTADTFRPYARQTLHSPCSTNCVKKLVIETRSTTTSNKQHPLQHQHTKHQHMSPHHPTKHPHHSKRTSPPCPCTQQTICASSPSPLQSSTHAAPRPKPFGAAASSAKAFTPTRTSSS